MRFLAVCSTTQFQRRCTISEVCSKFPRKNQEKFFSHSSLQITKKPQKTRWDALSSTLHRPLQTEWRNTFFHFFIKDLNKTHKKDDTGENCGFYNRSNRESHRRRITRSRDLFRTSRLKLRRCKTEACTGAL